MDMLLYISLKSTLEFCDSRVFESIIFTLGDFSRTSDKETD